MEIYKAKKIHFLTVLSRINKKYNTISLLRLLAIVLFLVSLYYYIKKDEIIFMILSIVLFAMFLFLMRIHTKLLFQKQVNKALLAINEDEISYLDTNKIPFEKVSWYECASKKGTMQIALLIES